ncbi:hypothetical protein GCM10010172_34060 [Paractinoplanes ferrugineus]|uniref:Secreted protein n=1 Tax=Paractinoplanes ferrugineus TaxID=113564 RepID=A0A919J5Z6_9ACTN|nr:hypothetical protein [Actinoplanes ferrugineus]GIE14663.1 hypothetical protein Afe05nite_65030 [Actinoplanes ferrugineus]
MRPISKFLLAMLGGLAFVLTSTSPAAAAPTPQNLGGLDLGAYCRSIGYADATLAGSTAYDWHCVTGDGRRGDLTFAAACRWTYATGAAVDRIGNFRDPASVSCWRVTPAIVQPDFTNYCTTTGHSAAALLGTTAYDWHCVSYNRSGPTYYDVDILAACFYTVGGAATVERFDNYYDPATWQCRV